MHQKLSENFIREFKDKVNWWNIPEHQILSKEFIVEFQGRINFYGLVKNKDLHKYSKSSQLFILQKIIENGCDFDDDFAMDGSYKCFTDYMKEQYEKLRIML